MLWSVKMTVLEKYFEIIDRPSTEVSRVWKSMNLLIFYHIILTQQNVMLFTCFKRFFFIWSSIYEQNLKIIAMIKSMMTFVMFGYLWGLQCKECRKNYRKNCTRVPPFMTPFIIICKNEQTNKKKTKKTKMCIPFVNWLVHWFCNITPTHSVFWNIVEFQNKLLPSIALSRKLVANVVFRIKRYDNSL